MTLLATVRKYLDIYKQFIRPFHRTSRVYHHTPVIAGRDGNGWYALELAAADRSRAALGIFRLANPAEVSYRLRLRGLDPGVTYRVTSEPDQTQRLCIGWQLVDDGLHIRLDTPLTSKLLLLEQVQP
jgi:alpha-galactosidase